MSDHDSDCLSKCHRLLFGKQRMPAEGGIDLLCKQYKSLLQCAPSRQKPDQPYFEESHHGTVPGKSAVPRNSRRENHIERAFANAQCDWLHPNGGSFRFLDYQFPIDVVRKQNRGIKAVDLVGIDDQDRFIVTELKVMSKGGSNDTPCTALLQGLRYAAVVQKNLETIAEEASSRFDSVNVRLMPPIVQLLATEAWWQHYESKLPPRFGAWAREIESKIRVTVECLAFDVECVEYVECDISNRKKPQFPETPNLRALRL